MEFVLDTEIRGSRLIRILVAANLGGGTAVYLSLPRAKYLAGRMIWSNFDMEQVEALKDVIVSKDLLKPRILKDEYFDSKLIEPKK